MENQNLALRFQGNESVRKTINNNIRYATDREEKAVYGQQLEDQIRQRRETEEKEKVQSREIARQLVINQSEIGSNLPLLNQLKSPVRLSC